MRTSFAMIATGVALSACGGGGGGGSTTKAPPEFSADPDVAFAEYAALHADLRTEAESQFHTAFSNGQFPTEGTLRFAGTWQNVLDGAGTPTTLYGLADVTANFETGTAGGTVSDFVGQTEGGPVGAFAGTVAITDGQIGKTSATTAQNDIFFDYGGTLTGNGQTIVLSGSNDAGKFLRTPITGFEATGTATATIDGVAVTDQMQTYTYVVK